MTEYNKHKLRFVTLDREETQKLSAVLKVVGVGGGGCNAIDSMIHRGLSGVEFIAVNTDAQALAKSIAPVKVQIGANITRGLGTGAIPNIGKKAAEEDRDKLTRILDGSDMVFVTCGMGGGTGTGAAPIVASIAKSLGALVVGIVTKPFSWEGKQRMKNAEEGIKELKQYVDSLIVVPNSRILSIIDSATAAVAAFDKPNEILYEATRGIADIITMTGVINVDFADVRTVMKESGQALMGCGIASGENRAVEAAQKAISSPLLEGVSIKGAKNILLNVSGSSNMTMQEVEAGNNIIFEAAGEEANVIFGAVIKEELNDYISYTVIATGFGSNGQSSSLNNLKQDQENKNATKKSFGGIGGFTRSKNEIENTDDLNIPTILRMRGKDPELFPDDNITTGFKANSGSLNQDEDLNPRKKKDDNDEEDSSSFLRKIMD
ncbi:cell division protein FtsZ [Rosettibacter firmus]|uniref:cell division protein FtsZ n=1 Tax=Rosettibacter firmus TaxID=3111522 RepID=UPI00336BC98C